MSLADAAKIIQAKFETGLVNTSRNELYDFIVLLAEEIDKIKELFDPADYVITDPKHAMAYDANPVKRMDKGVSMLEAMEKLATGEVERVPLSSFMESDIEDKPSAVRPVEIIDPVALATDPLRNPHGAFNKAHMDILTGDRPVIVGQREFRVSFSADTEDKAMLHLHSMLIDYHTRKRDEATSVLDRMNHTNVIKRLGHYIRHAQPQPDNLQDQMSDVLGLPRDSIAASDKPPSHQQRLKELGELIANTPTGCN